MDLVVVVVDINLSFLAIILLLVFYIHSNIYLFCFHVTNVPLFSFHFSLP